MSTATESPAEVAEQTHSAGHDHPRDSQYVVIALILGAITAAEVGTYFLDDPSTTFLVVALFPMMIAKFAIVAGFFMHLRYDSRIFRWLFVSGLALAVVVFGATMASLEFFSDDFLRFLR